MKVFNQARIFIYRINQKGLEVFLLEGPKNGSWKVPQSEMDFCIDQFLEGNNLIELSCAKDEKGTDCKAYALEGDWHDIPSIRKMFKDDVTIVKHTIKSHIPQVNSGGFYAIKVAFKKVMPHEYKFLKELKDVLLDRNQALSI